jgi:Tfp pilus assembly protein PilF
MREARQGEGCFFGEKHQKTFVSFVSCGVSARVWLGFALAAAAAPAARAQFVDPAAPQTATVQNDATAAAVSALLAQAKYWQANGAPSQSLDSLRRLLQLDPTNADALVLRVQIELTQGDTVSASQDMATLRQLQPTAAQIPLLARMQAEAANPVDTDALTAARNAAQAGNYALAVSLYRQAFHGSAPPSAYALEYYQTMAGTPDGWGQTLSGLSDIVSENPGDLQAQLAFARVETYQASERQAGISRLAALTSYPAIARGAATAWKQALAFLPETPDSVPLYQAYLAKFPNDPQVQTFISAANTPKAASPADTEGDDRAKAFAALNAGDLSSAASLFQAALAIETNDPDALGGMGLVRLRQGESGAARDFLQRAIAADPAAAAQWKAALSGADRAAAYASATSLLNAGDLTHAERALNEIIAGGGDTTGAYEMLATAQTRQGDLAGAAASWRAVLARDPHNGQALVGLGSILSRQGDQQGAQTLFQQAAASGQGALVASAQADALRRQARAASNPTVALALARAAVAAAPDDPWARLDLARALKSAGQNGEARQQMDQLIGGPNPSTADLQAAALFAAGDDRLADANALVARLPASAMTPDMRAIQARFALTRQVANAVAQGAGNPALTRQLLVTMAATPDPDGSRGAAIATALVNAGDPEGAQLAIQTAIAANPAADAAALMNYANALLNAGQDSTALQLVQNLQSRGGLTPDQQQTLTALSDGLAIRASDRLAKAGKLADAYDQLAPGLAKSPDDPALNMALARLYQDDHQPKQALAINQALLTNDPHNLEARDGAVNAAIAAGDTKTASQLVQTGESLQPNEPRVWVMAANLAQAQGDNGAALSDLQTAQTLRQQQLIAQSGGAPAVALAAANPVQVNPFGSADGGLSDPGPSVLGVPAGTYPMPPTPPDALSQQIASQINTLQAAQMAFGQAGLDLNSRSGSSGLDQLQTFSTPIIGSFSPRGVGTVSLTATPIFLLAGQVSGDPTSLSRFGSDALDSAAVPKDQSAAGVGVNAAYTLPWFKANVGGTPFGFHTENLVGGAELDPTLPGGVSLSLAASRQPVTDSLLSYASTVDPRTGALFGAVLRDRVNAQVTLQTGAGYVYVGGGADQLKGKHVARNNEIEFGAGGAYPVEQTDSSTTTAGVNVTYFSYSKNLRYFTLGQGGYFSPQSYFAVTIPLDYKETDGALTWEVGAMAGVQSYTENASPYYPEDPGLQAKLAAAAATSTYLQSTYPGDSETGIVGGVHGNFEYRLNNEFVIGGKLDYQRTANWNQTDALLYARYLLGGPPQ